MSGLRPHLRFAHRKCLSGGLVLVVLGAAAALSVPLVYAASNWAAQNPASHPSPRFGAAGAYDASRHELVMFGGFDNHNMSDETWTWNGTSWSLRNPPTRPSARAYSGMAYDASLGRVVLFGGNPNQNIALADTWTWDGATWAQGATATSPPGRQGAGMDYMPETGRVVLFGGIADGASRLLSDTWTFDGGNWSKVDTSSVPTARYGARLAYSAVHHAVVLYGGITCDAAPCSNYSALADTWEFAGTQWVHVQGASGPGTRSHYVMAFDQADQRLVMTGGYRYASGGSSYLADTWAYGLNRSWQRVAVTDPPARENAGYGFVSAAGHLLMFGGLGPSGVLSDTWTYSTQPTAPPGGGATPPPRGQVAPPSNSPASGRPPVASSISPSSPASASATAASPSASPAVVALASAPPGQPISHSNTPVRQSGTTGNLPVLLIGLAFVLVAGGGSAWLFARRRPPGQP